MTICDELRASVLQAAIQGKLVKQIPEEGTGEELYRRIQNEKKALIKVGTIKKDKRLDLSEPNEGDTPFNAPENWKWLRFGSILDKLTDGTHSTPKYTTAGVKFVSVKDMSSGVLSLDNTKFISEEEHRVLFCRCNPERGDILLSKVGTTGVPAIVNTDEQFSLFVSVALLKFNHTCIDEYFLYYLILSPLVQEQAKENTRGVGNKNWVLDAIANTMIVLPPLSEQKRIVTRVDELMSKIDELEKIERELEELKKAFPGDMKAALLQAAMQGKLTDQREEDGTGDDLYRHIQEEKKKLIEAGKIKKEKPLPEISDDEKPFDIPNNWSMARLGDVSSYAQAKKKINAKDADKSAWMLDLEDIEKGGRLLAKCVSNEKKAIGDKTCFKKGDILFSKLRPYLLKILVADDDGICTPELIPFNMYGGFNSEYIVYYLKSPYVNDEINRVTYGVKMPRVGTETMVNFVVPVPPLAEQKRIVEKLDRLLPLVDGLAEDKLETHV